MTVFKRGIGAFLATITILSNNLVAFADSTQYTDSNTTKAVLTQEAANFNVTVPGQLPIDVDEENVVTVATDVAVQNNSSGPIRIHSIKITPMNEWDRVQSVDSRVGKKEFTLQVDTESDTVPSKQSTLIIYSSEVSPQSTPQNVVVAQVEFMVGWNEMGEANITDPSTVEFVPGDSKVLKFDFSKAESDEIAWESSNDSVATVESHTQQTRSALISGEKFARITAHAVGNCIITGTLKDGTKSSISIQVVDKTVSSLEITKQPIKTSYIEKQDFDTDGMEITAHYNNGTSAIITDYELSNDKALEIGTQDVTISYGSKSVEISLEVVKKSISSIFIKTPPSKTTYIEGEDFEIGGMVVMVGYDNGTQDTLSSYDLSNNTNLTIDQTYITIKHLGFEVKQPIEVIAKAITKLEIVTPSNKTVYTEGNSFDPAGLVIKAYYNNGLSETITDYTLSNNISLVVGQESVLINYGGKSINQPITVQAKVLTGISVTTPPTQTSYIEANNFNANGMVVKANYNNGTSEVVSNYTLSNNTNLVKGQTIVTISWGGKTTTQAIQVVAKTLTSIAVTTRPTQTAYIEANNFNTAGMVVMAYYNNGTSTAISGWTVTDGTNMPVGKTAVTVSWGGKTTTTPISVRAKALASIAVATAPSKTAYYVTENFNAAGLSIRAYYDNGTNAIVSGWAISNGGNMFNGQNFVTITYGGKSVTTPIRVAYPTVGTKYVYGNYEYSFSERYDNGWNGAGFDGWGVRIIDTNQSVYAAPLTNIYGKNVVSYCAMFQNYTVPNITLTGSWGNGVTDMEWMFHDAKIYTINGLTNFNTSSVTMMENMFDETSNLQVLDLSSFVINSWTSIDYMLQNCGAHTRYARTQAEVNRLNEELDVSDYYAARFRLK